MHVVEGLSRRGDRAVEGARLEIVCTPNKGTGGSNPPLSAIFTYENQRSDCLALLPVQEKSFSLYPSFVRDLYRTSLPLELSRRF